MGCRNREFSQDEETAVSDSIGDALLFTTMCIIGLPVNVHIKDGSIYTGIFHTVCVEDEYAIVLKRARMTKKGSHGANVANGGVIETLVILSEDLVQVVAKGVLLPPNGFSGSAARDDVGASIESAEREEKSAKSSKSGAGRKQASQTRCSSRTVNGFANGFTPLTSSQPGNALEVENGESGGTYLAKKEDTFSFPVIARQVGDGESRAKQGDNGDKYKIQRNLTMHESQGPSSSSDACAAQLKLAENVCEEATHKVLPNVITAGISSAVSSVVDVTSASSRTLTEMAPPKSSSSNRTAKEFKLNPGAKIFSPSFVNQRTATPPAVPTATSVTYVQDNCSVLPIATGHPEVEISPFAPPRSSLPVKFVPYGNLVAGNGGSDMQYSQPIVGHMGNRAQATRYAGQYHHPVQAGPTFMHPNSQNVMVGRLGPLVYVHPVSNDLVQSATTFSQVSTCPLLTPHQVHLRKHQGNAAAAQALQLCVTTPPFIANGQQPFTVPAHIPISQQAFPVIRPIPLPIVRDNSKFS